MAKILTIKAIESAKPKEREYKLTVDRGLYIRVANDGVKTWLVRYVVDKKQKQFRLPKPFGVSGDGFMSLVEARAFNAEIQALARTGMDYQINLKEKKQAVLQEKQLKLAEELTFQDLYDSWIKDGVTRADGNKFVIQSFRKHAIPILGSIQLRKLTEHELRAIYRSIIGSGKIATAVELSKDIKQMLTWGEKRKPWRSLMIDGNPSQLVDVSKLVPHDYTKIRKRILSENEIRKLKNIFDSTAEFYEKAEKKYGVERPLKKEAQIALWLCLSTICRIGELLLTEWKHVDFDAQTWFIPAANTKGERGQKRDHLIYLSNFTLEQFKQLHALTGKSLWAFPATYIEGSVSEKSVSKLVGDRQITFKKRSRKLQFRVENNSLVLSDEDWTPHDLRRTGATQIQRIIGGQAGHFVAELCLNHVVITGSGKHYLLDENADVKRDAWNKLGDWLELVLSSDNVMRIKSV